MFLAGLAKGEELNNRVEDLLDSVELPRSYRNRYPHELSGGQKQRVGIARALSLSPSLLIADEPTSALDVSVQARFLDLLQELQDRLKFACLFITHDIGVVDILAHRIAVMQYGKLVEVGPRDQILNKPRELYTKTLLAAVPVPDPKEQKKRREARAKLIAGVIAESTAKPAKKAPAKSAAKPAAKKTPAKPAAKPAAKKLAAKPATKTAAKKPTPKKK
jgi:peptide/nickel transport system ATP-binding protein